MLYCNQIISIGVLIMAIGERIRYFRNKKGMTQKQLGVSAGFPERSADIRMNQYESGARTPKEDLTKMLSLIFDVSTHALNVPDIDTDLGLIHTLFALEDTCGLTVDEADGEVCLKIDLTKGSRAIGLHRTLCVWKSQVMKLKNGEITQEEYDMWRYRFPSMEPTAGWHRVMSFDTDDIRKAMKKRF